MIDNANSTPPQTAQVGVACQRKKLARGTFMSTSEKSSCVLGIAQITNKPNTK